MQKLRIAHDKKNYTLPTMDSDKLRIVRNEHRQITHCPQSAWKNYTLPIMSMGKLRTVHSEHGELHYGQ